MRMRFVFAWPPASAGWGGWTGVGRAFGRGYGRQLPVFSVYDHPSNPIRQLGNKALSIEQHHVDASLLLSKLNFRLICIRLVVAIPEQLTGSHI